VSAPGAPEATSPSHDGAPVAADREVAGNTRVRRLVRFVGTLLVVAGIGTVAWTILVWQWQDPFTALYTLYEQHKLAGRYHRIDESYRPLLVQRQTREKAAPAVEHVAPAVQLAEERRLIRADAKRYRSTLRAGTPLGRIKIRRIGLNIILVTGTDHDSLTKGPGWDQRTFLPGSGELIYIAGHRTTYLAPFAHIDSMRPGDLVTIEVPYGTFVYRVRSHVIVPSDDLSRLRSYNRPSGVPPGEVIALQACHPRFFATHRYIVYAVLVRVVPKGGKPYDARR
jgi:sortase A